MALPAAGGAWPAAADWVDEPTFTATGVTVDKRTVRVSAFDVATVTVTVTGGFSGPRDGRDLWVSVPRPANPRAHPFRQDLRLRLVGGTQSQGRWQGSLRLPSTADGTWTLSHVYPWEECRDDVVGGACKGTPVDWGTITVTGRHIPKLSAWVRPKPLAVSRPAYEVRGLVLDSQTNRPFRVKAPVELLFDTGCGADTLTGAGHSAVTRSDGSFTIVVKNSLTSAIDSGNPVPYPKGYRHCVKLGRPGVAKPSTIVNSTDVGMVLQPSVTARPVATSVRLGRTVRVDGRAQDPHQKVFLQQKVGRTRWRTVATVPLRLSGRFTLYAKPTAKGRTYYRATQPGRSDSTTSVRPAASKTFAVLAR